MRLHLAQLEIRTYRSMATCSPMMDLFIVHIVYPVQENLSLHPKRTTCFPSLKQLSSRSPSCCKPCPGLDLGNKLDTICAVTTSDYLTTSHHLITMLGKFRRSLRLDKNPIVEKLTSDCPVLEPLYCHAYEQYTSNSNRRGFGSFSSLDLEKAPWAEFSNSSSDSGYESLDGGNSQPTDSLSDSPADDARSIWSMALPTRTQTYCSSVYSSDIPTAEALDPFPTMEEVVEEDTGEMFGTQARCWSQHPSRPDERSSRPFEPPRSRFARLNEMPAASSRFRTGRFPADVFDDVDAGIERQELKGKPKQKRNRWGSKGSISSIIVLPSRLRALSRASSS